jgi:hypothetical protein
MRSVPARVLLAAGAWLLGVLGATGGSLAAVSLIGQSFAAPPTQQLTVAAVNHALAGADHDASPAATASPTATARRSPARHGPARRRRAASQSTGAPATPGTGGGTVLTSSGGSVLASCVSSGAYLISWSPQQGYQVDDVVRGPAATARVVFLAGPSGVRVDVTCAGSLPTEAVHRLWGDDDGTAGGGDS